MKKDNKIDSETSTFDGTDLLNDVKKLLCSDDIPDIVISDVIRFFQHQDDFMTLLVRKDEPGEYRNFLKKIILNLPISYANHKIEEITKGLKSNFKLSEADAQIIFSKSFEMTKPYGVSNVLENYAANIVNEQTVPDDKKPPFKVIDPNERGLKIVKEEVTIH